VGQRKFGTKPDLAGSLECLRVVTSRSHTVAQQFRGVTHLTRDTDLEIGANGQVSNAVESPQKYAGCARVLESHGCLE